MTRSGNRQLNAALHRIAVTQIRLDGLGRTYYRHRLDHPLEPTAAMQLGTAVHMLVLEPARFAEVYTVADFDARTTAGKAAKAEAEAAGKTLLKPELADTVIHELTHNTIFKSGDDDFLAIDAAHAGVGDTVLVCQEGNSTRQVMGNPNARASANAGG